MVFFGSPACRRQVRNGEKDLNITAQDSVARTFSAYLRQ
jgi:hypothetical protein